MALSGYSGTPLAKKLGIKEGSKVRLVNEPSNCFALFSDMPKRVSFMRDRRSTKDVVHFFTKKQQELIREIGNMKKEIFPDGTIWISWPKKSSKVDTDITEDIIRTIALENGLVDVKVCAIDETWSGLKLVVPVKDR